MCPAPHPCRATASAISLGTRVPSGMAQAGSAGSPSTSGVARREGSIFGPRSPSLEGAAGSGNAGSLVQGTGNAGSHVASNEPTCPRRAHPAEGRHTRCFSGKLAPAAEPVRDKNEPPPARSLPGFPDGLRGRRERCLRIARPDAGPARDRRPKSPSRWRRRGRRHARRVCSRSVAGRKPSMHRDAGRESVPRSGRTGRSAR